MMRGVGPAPPVQPTKRTAAMTAKADLGGPIMRLHGRSWPTVPAPLWAQRSAGPGGGILHPMIHEPASKEPSGGRVDPLTWEESFATYSHIIVLLHIHILLVLLSSFALLFSLSLGMIPPLRGWRLDPMNKARKQELARPVLHVGLTMKDRSGMSESVSWGCGLSWRLWTPSEGRYEMKHRAEQGAA